MKKFKRIIVLFLFLVLLMPALFVHKYFSFHKEAVAQAVTPVIDSRSSTATATRTPTMITWDHTVNNNVNRFLLVGVQQLSNISSVTYNGISLNFLTQADSNMIFYINNPPVGTYPIQINIEDSSTAVAGAMSLFNVNTIIPFNSADIVNFCTVDGENPVSITVPNTNTSQLVIGTASTYGKKLTEAVGMTREWLDSIVITGDFDGSYGNSKPGVAGNTILSWNNQNPFPRVCVSGLAINPASAPSPTPSPTPTITPTSGPIPTPVVVYAISGKVYIDANRNGIKDAEGAYSSSTKVTLSGDASLTDMTDNQGNYNFSGLHAGIYWVTLTLPAGYKDTTPISRKVIFP